MARERGDEGGTHGALGKQIAEQIRETKADAIGIHRIARAEVVTEHLVADEAERVFKALGEGGTVTMPMEKTFWAARFGMLTDRFGVLWMIIVMP